MPKIKKIKDPFQDLPEEWKDACAGEDVGAINARIAEVAKAEALNRQAKDEDVDLARAKEEAKIAGQQYSDATKMNRLKVKYAMQVLGDRGVEGVGV
jgi:hypothetical protein